MILIRLFDIPTIIQFYAIVGFALYINFSALYIRNISCSNIQMLCGTPFSDKILRRLLESAVGEPFCLDQRISPNFNRPIGCPRFLFSTEKVDLAGSSHDGRRIYPDAVVHSFTFHEQVLFFYRRNDYKIFLIEYLSVFIGMASCKREIFFRTYNLPECIPLQISLLKLYPLHHPVMRFQKRNLFRQKSVGVLSQQFTGIQIITKKLP